MKRLVIVIAIISMSWCCFAQDNNSDVSSLSISVVQPKRDFLTDDVCWQLETRMTQILSANGVVNTVPSNRFVMTAKANVLNKDIIAGAPARVSEEIELTFIIGDVLDNKIYGTHAVNLIGVGLNENKALLSAIKNVKVGDKELALFVEQAKTKIVQYYIDNESQIVESAIKLSAEGKYDAALYQLSLVPDACKDCFFRCQEKMLQIIQQKIDSEGEMLLNQAHAIWAANPNASGADEVYPLVSQINTNASCYAEVQPFLNSITKKLINDDKRAWEFMVKQYEDEKAKEQRNFEFKVQQYQDGKEREQRNFEARQAAAARNAVIRQQQIRAARDVAMEYAKNQPEVVYYKTNNTLILW